MQRTIYKTTRVSHCDLTHSVNCSNFSSETHLNYNLSSDWPAGSSLGVLVSSHFPHYSPIISYQFLSTFISSSCSTRAQALFQPFIPISEKKVSISQYPFRELPNLSYFSQREQSVESWENSSNILRYYHLIPFKTRTIVFNSNFPSKVFCISQDLLFLTFWNILLKNTFHCDA